MRKQLSLEMKVGAFILSGLGLLVFLLFAIGDLATYFQPGYTLHVLFDTANGLGRGSPVQYAGVEVGKVEDLRIVHPGEGLIPQVELQARLPKTIQIRSDDLAAISTFGLLGEKYLEITPGPGAGQFLDPGDRLKGLPPVSTELIIQRSNEVLTEFKRTLEGLNSFVADTEAQIYLKETLREARDATRHWRVLGERLNLAMLHIEDGQGSIGKFLYDEELYNRAIAFMDDLRAHPWKLLIRPPKGRSKS
jgi:phospholipid/cholesterol/gamma-HCH transport system substrate-binding protein